MATSEEVEKLIKRLKDVTEIEIDDLIQDKDWGSINFESAKSDLERLYSICNHLKVLPIDQLPSDIANQIFNESTPINTTITNIRNFSIEQSNPSGVRDQYVNEVTANVDRFYKCSHIYVPYLAYQKGEIQNNIKQLTGSVEESKRLLENTKKSVISKSGEIDKIINAAREASASVGVAHFTADFVAESETMESQAEKWLNATMALAAASLISAVYFLNAQPNLSDVAHAIQYISSKILFLVLLLTATLWCGNLYKAAKHQAAANKFKGNSLKTFQAFVNATDNDAVKDAVLLAATNAIFNESSTGYISGESSGIEATTKIVEVVKNGSQAISASAKS